MSREQIPLKYLKNLGTIKTPTNTRTPTGEVTQEFSETYSNIPCNLQVESSEIAFEVSGQEYRQTHNAFFNYSQDLDSFFVKVKPLDRFVDKDGLEYHIIDIQHIQSMSKAKGGYVKLLLSIQRHV